MRFKLLDRSGLPVSEVAPELELGQEHLERLEAVSQISGGFPHHFLDQDDIKDLVYGRFYSRIDPPGEAR